MQERGLSEEQYIETRNDMSIQFNVCPLNHVSILREMFTDRMKSNI